MEATATKTTSLRNVRAALKAADIRLYSRPKTNRTHNGQVVQSIGWYGVESTQIDRRMGLSLMVTAGR